MLLALLAPFLLFAQTVTSTANDGPGSLREVIANAAPGATVTFDAATDGSIIALESEIILDKSLTITGNGMEATRISGQSMTRIFNADAADMSVEISALTLTGGLAGSGGALRVGPGTNATLSGVRAMNNEATGDAATMGGGAIVNMGGNLTVRDSRFLRNRASGTSGSGGAIINLSQGNLRVMGGYFEGNQSSRAGGAIEDASGAGSGFSVTGAEMVRNETGPMPGNGGAIHVSGDGDATIVRGRYFKNVAASEGGGLWNSTGTMTIDDALVLNNVAAGDAADNGGGGLFNNGGTLHVRNTLVDFNRATGASGSGGGVLNDADGILTIERSEVKNGQASRAGGGIEDNSGATGSVTLTNVNLVNNRTGAAPGNGGGLHVTGPGTVVYTTGRVRDNYAASEGGGLWNGTGTMTVTGVEINNNSAMGDAADNGGGGIFNLAGGTLVVKEGTRFMNNRAGGASGSGGGILADVGCTLSVTGAYFIGNSASRAGGAIEDNSGASTTAEINSSFFMQNTTGSMPGNGGAIHITGPGNMNVTGGIFRKNVAASEGGGLWNGSGTMTLDNVRVLNNDAKGDDADNGGGGIFNNGGTLRLKNTLVDFNRATGASGSGGGIFNATGGTLVAEDSEIKNGQASRAGGGIEDNSGADGSVSLTNVNLVRNRTGSAPGNGGGLHVTGMATVDITGGTIRDNTAASEGGGLWNGMGTMTVAGTLLQRNTAKGDAADNGGGAIFNVTGGDLVIGEGTRFMDNHATGMSGSGGAILMDKESSLTVTKAVFRRNSASRAGGAIEDNSGGTTTANINESEFYENVTGAAPGNGGAIHITGNGNMNVIGGIFSRNEAASEGGGLWNGSGTMTIDDVLVLNNTAKGDAADNGGGGLFNNGGTMRVSNTLVDFNGATGASGSGGGIFNEVGGTLMVMDSEIKNGQASRAGGGIEDNSGADGSVTLNNVNLINNATGSAPGNGGGMHVTGPGNIKISGGTVRDNTAASEGGGLWNGSGMMTVSGTTINNNIAQGDAADNGGGGIFNLIGGTLVVEEGTRFEGNSATGTSGSGGAILMDGESILTVSDATFIGNSASRAGGAIEDNSGASTTAEIFDCFFMLNTTGSMPGNGGAIHITGPGNMNIFGGEFRRNIAASEGGALWNGSGSMLVMEATIINNRAAGADSDNGGGGIFNNGGDLMVDRSTIARNFASGANGTGGGILDIGGTATVQTSTISGNTSRGGGGGIWTVGIMGVSNSTVVNNRTFAGSTGGGIGTLSTGVVTLFGTIVALNEADSNADVFGTVESAGYNLIGINDGDYEAAQSDIVGTPESPVDPMIRALSMAGGPTMTHVLECGSPALDAGEPNNMDLDQRGKAVMNGTRDIGAFERQTVCPNTMVDPGRETTEEARMATTPSIYPNPVTSSTINVEVPESYGDNAELQFTDLTGRVRLSRRVSAGIHQIPVPAQANGTYLLRLNGADQTSTTKIIVRR